jgi:hypothetical protein
MALDRAWFNALVDDSGDGISGSVWDKADIANLLNSVDAEILRLDGNISAGPVTPILQSYGGGTPVYAFQSAFYVKSKLHVAVFGRIGLSSKGSLAAGGLVLGGFPHAASASLYQSGITIGYFTGLATSVSSLSTAMNPSLGSANLYYVPGAGGAGVAALSVADIGVNFDLMFGGSYKVDV